MDNYSVVLCKFKSIQGITSKYTSFIAIDEKNNKPLSDLVMETRNIPSQFVHDSHDRQNDRRVVMRLVPEFSPREYKSKSSRNSIRNMMKSLVMPKLASHSKSAPFQKDNKAMPNPLYQSMSTRGECSSSSLCYPKLEATIGGKRTSTGNSVSDTTSPLLQLISLQSFDGSYSLNEELAAIFNKSLCEIKEGSEKAKVPLAVFKCQMSSPIQVIVLIILGATNLKLEDQIFATVLAISFFITKLSSEKDSWELIVKKARKWLGSTLQPENVDDAIKAATTFLGA